MPTAPTARPGPWLSALTAALCLALCAPAALAAPEVLPYDGVLYLDGQPVNQPVNMRFSLYGAAEGGDALWTETWDPATAPVDVKGGRFHAKLGSFQSITARILDAGTLWVGVEVMNAANAWRPLGGRQRLKKLPYAGKTLGGGDQCGALQCNEDSGATRFVIEADLTAARLSAQAAIVEQVVVPASQGSQAQGLDIDQGGAATINRVILNGGQTLNANAVNAGTLAGSSYATNDLVLNPDADRTVSGVINLTVNGAVRLARFAEDGVDFMRLVDDALVFNPD
ncbi:MAG: hypothetical protein KC613_27260, partial [Myxococcales bacterium]|nr:hypothetical protein [Myxococcales bacterium]